MTDVSYQRVLDILRNQIADLSLQVAVQTAARERVEAQLAELTSDDDSELPGV